MNECGLVRYDAMCRAIDACYEVDEVKELRDKAAAMAHYFRMAKNPEPERRACEIRLRAERKGGQILSEMEKPKASLGNQYTGKLDPSPDSRGPKTRAELGVSYKDASKWQQAARIPEEEFEGYIATSERPTIDGLLNRQQSVKTKPMDQTALWFWSKLLEFERNPFSMKNLTPALNDNPNRLLAEMTDEMRADTLRLIPRVIEWLERIEDER